MYLRDNLEDVRDNLGNLRDILGDFRDNLGGEGQPRLRGGRYNFQNRD